jgi:hypothetical protein
VSISEALRSLSLTNPKRLFDALIVTNCEMGLLNPEELISNREIGLLNSFPWTVQFEATLPLMAKTVADPEEDAGTLFERKMLPDTR